MVLSSIETSLINTGDVRVVDHARQAALIREIGMQQIALQGNAFTAEQEQVHHKREAMRRALRTPRLYTGKEKKY